MNTAEEEKRLLKEIDVCSDASKGTFSIMKISANCFEVCPYAWSYVPLFYSSVTTHVRIWTHEQENMIFFAFVRSA